MPVSRSEFDAAYSAKLSGLSARILRVLQDPDQALTASEITARLLGHTGRYASVLLAEVMEATPTVQEAADALVSAGKLRATVITRPMSSPQTYYAT